LTPAPVGCYYTGSNPCNTPAMPTPPIPLRVCPHCDSSFQPARKDQLFCASRCRFGFHNEARRLEQEALYAELKRLRSLQEKK
jgi:hypothetical protein